MVKGLYEFLLVVQIMSIIVLMLECAFIISRQRTKLHGILLFVCAVILFNNVGYLLAMTSNSQEGYIVALKMSYFGRVWIPFALLLFTLHLCGQKYSNLLISILAAVHAFTYVLILTFENNTLYYSSYYYTMGGLFPHAVCAHGLWHNLFQYVLVISYVIYGISLLIINLIREKDKLVKKRLITITLSIIVESVFFILEALGVGSTYDMTMLGYSIGAIIMGVGLFKYDIMGTMEMAKDFCLEEIPEGVIVINPLGHLEYANVKAKKILKLKNKKEIDAQKVQTIVEMLEDRIVQTGSLELADRVYSIEKKTLVHDGSIRGTVYVLEDDTKIYRYMDALQEQTIIAQAAKEEAESASASKSAFLSIVSHEIRTPNECCSWYDGTFVKRAG